MQVRDFDDKASVLAVIPFYKRQDQLDRCLAALAASTHPVTTWVHDNSVENLGFTRAVNRGLSAAADGGFDFVLVLNQDCYLRPTAVAALVRLVRERPACAIAGLKQLHGSDPDLIVHGGCTDAYPVGKHEVGRVSAGNHAADRPMPWVNGAAMFARMSAVREFGQMDPNLVMIGSDSDWCYTARARGWEVWYCAAAEAVHEMGVSFAGPGPEMRRVFESDQNWWRMKWISGTYRQLAGNAAAVPVGDRPMPGKTGSAIVGAPAFSGLVPR
jgi:GT2 family glycosyltransferase